MFLLSVSFEIQVILFSISFGLGVFLALSLAYFKSKKLCCIARLFSDNKIDSQADAENVNSSKVPEECVENFDPEKRVHQPIEQSNEIIHLTVRTENKPESNVEKFLNNYSINNQYHQNRTHLLNKSKLDLSKVEAKYLNFNKSKRASYTNYLQKSKKSFIGYELNAPKPNYLNENE